MTDYNILDGVKALFLVFIFQSDLLAKEFGRVRYRLELYDMER